MMKDAGNGFLQKCLSIQQKPKWQRCGIWFLGPKNYAQTDERRSNETTPKPWDPWNTLVEFAQWNHLYGLNIGFGNMNYQEFSLHRYSEIPLKQQTNNKHSNIKFSIHNTLQGIVQKLHVFPHQQSEAPHKVPNVAWPIVTCSQLFVPVLLVVSARWNTHLHDLQCEGWRAIKRILWRKDFQQNIPRRIIPTVYQQI